jgi:hypothetical protein
MRFIGAESTEGPKRGTRNHEHCPTTGEQTNMKTLPVLAAFAAATLIAGCEKAPVAMAKEGGRAQRMVAHVVTESNEFVGVWISPPSQTVNDWIVVFTENGMAAINGPGLEADGKYSVEGNVAKLAYRKRNGKSWDKQTEFKLSGDKTGLVFSTGEPLDPPVKLIRSTSIGNRLPTPSLKQTVDPAAGRNPFTLASIQG